MIAAELHPGDLADFAPRRHELLEIHHSKISLHRAKAGYDYPTIRLPHTLSKLAVYPRESIRLYATDRWPFSW
ncbi:MAG: hypothetical protein WBZ42_02090 [Halobacteriota archaeon]